MGRTIVTADVWLAPLAAVSGIVSGPLLDRAIARAVAQRAEGPAPPGRRGLRPFGLALAVGALECTAALRIGLAWSLAPVAVFIAGLAALAWCDGELYLLPKRIQHPTAIASAALLLAAAGATGQWHRLGTSVACGAVAFAVFLALNLANPKAMAFGDVRLAGTIGLVVGWFGVTRAITAFVVTSAAAALVAGTLLAGRRISLRSHLPYGVFLAIGAVVAILV